MLKSGSSHRIGVCGSKYQISIDYLSYKPSYTSFWTYQATTPDPWIPQKIFYFKTYYLRPIQYFSILINILYFILNVFKIT